MQHMVEGAESHVHADGVDLRLSDDCQQWQDTVVAEDPVHVTAEQPGVTGEGGREGGIEGKD